MRCCSWAIVLLASVTFLHGRPWEVAFAAAAALIWTALLPLQVLRIARGIRHRAGSWNLALAYGMFTMIAKWANVIGQRQYARDRAAGKLARMIDYKSARQLAPSTHNAT